MRSDTQTDGPQPWSYQLTYFSFLPLWQKNKNNKVMVNNVVAGKLPRNREEDVTHQTHESHNLCFSEVTTKSSTFQTHHHHRHLFNMELFQSRRESSQLISKRSNSRDWSIIWFYCTLSADSSLWLRWCLRTKPHTQTQTPYRWLVQTSLPWNVGKIKKRGNKSTSFPKIWNLPCANTSGK